MKHFAGKAALGLCGLLGCLSSSAQSGVFLSGQIGAGIGLRSHQGVDSKRVVEVSDNLMTASFLRFSGAEDLGGGMRALFVLETGLNPDTGSQVHAQKFWNRQSWLGLQLANKGTITMGRQFHAAVDRSIRTMDVNYFAGSNGYATPVSAFGVSRYAGNDTRSDNTIKYRNSQPGMLELGVSASPGESSATSGSSYSVDVARITQSSNFGVAYARYNAGRQAGHPTPAETFWVVGGSMQFGALRPYLSYYDNRINSAPGTSVAGGRTQHNRVASLGLAAQLSGPMRMTAAWYYDKGRDLNGVEGRDGNKNTAVVSLFYALSKRTELYATLYQNRYSGGYRAETFNLLGFAPRNAASAAQSGQSVGIAHRF